MEWGGGFCGTGMCEEYFGGEDGRGYIVVGVVGLWRFHSIEVVGFWFWEW